MTLTAEQRLAEATRAAIEEWESMDAPLARGYTEETRTNLRGWPDNGASTREVYRLAVHFVEQTKIAAQNAAAQEAMRARRVSQARLRESMTDEMRELRESLGLSQAEMDALLDLKPGMANNSEKPQGGYALDRVEALLRRYRAAAKVGAKAASKS